MKVRYKLMALVLVLSLGAGCSTAWLSTFEGWVRIAGPILIQILDIVSLAEGTNPSPVLVAKINGDAASLNTVAQSVANASSQNLPSVCAAFNVAVTTLAGDEAAIEQLANTGGQATGEINAIIGIAQATFQEIEGPIAACQAAPTTAAARTILTNAALRAKSPSAVVTQFNAAVDAKHRVHIHSAAARWVTFGVLK